MPSLCITARDEALCGSVNANDLAERQGVEAEAQRGTADLGGVTEAPPGRHEALPNLNDVGTRLLPTAGVRVGAARSVIG